MQLYHCRALPCKVLHQSVDHLKHVVLLTPSFAQMSELTQGNFIEAISVRLQNSLPHPRNSTSRSRPQIENGKQCSALQFTRSGAISFFTFYDIMGGRSELYENIPMQTLPTFRLCQALHRYAYSG